MAATCCKSKSTVIMYTVNILLLLVGIAITAVAGVLTSNRQQLVDSLPSFKDAVSMGAVYAALAGGIALMVMALIGLCGAKFYEKCCGKFLLTLYSIILLLILALHIAIVAVVFSMSAQFQDLKTARTANAMNEAQKQIQSFANATFTLCCPNGVVNNADVCKYMAQVVTTTTCAGSFQAFEDKLMDFLAAQFRSVGIVAAVIVALLLTVLVASCCLLCRKKDEEANKHQTLATDNPATGVAPTFA